MTFDMTKCKIGDKLKTRGGNTAQYTSYDSSNQPYCWWIDDEISVNAGGYRYGQINICDWDIVGFQEETTISPTITHNLTIKGHTHVLTTEELGEVYRLIDETLGGI